MVTDEQERQEINISSKLVPKIMGVLKALMMMENVLYILLSPDGIIKKNLHKEWLHYTIILCCEGNSQKQTKQNKT